MRCSAATILADMGVNLINLKRFGRWKSDSVAQSYVGESLHNKRKMADLLSAGNFFFVRKFSDLIHFSFRHRKTKQTRKKNQRYNRPLTPIHYHNNQFLFKFLQFQFLNNL